MKLHKKFWVSLLAVAAVLLCVFALPEKAQAATASDVIFKLNSAGDGYVVSDYKGSISGALEIPATYNGLPVTEIGSQAFRECETLTSVVIPYGVTKIGWSAFCECKALTSITIPNSVTTIENGAFSYCSSLTSLTIPNSVTKLGEDVFARCAVLNDLRVAQGNPVYHSAGNCIIETATKTLVAGCNASRIPTDGSVTKIGSYAFSECTRMESITIPDGVTTIGTYAFYNCQSLTGITIPTSVTSIGGWAFYSCRGLNTVTIPQGVTSIGYCAFYECRNLTRAVIPNSVTSIGGSAFSGCNNLGTVVYCGTQEQWNAVQKDTNSLFSYGTVLKYHSYTNSVCSYCQECDPGILTFERNETADGYIVSACPQTAGGNLTIPATYNGLPVVGIGVKAFKNCASLTSVRVPDSVTVIDWDSFSGCTALTSINIPDGITLIGSGAFYGCGNLTYNTYDNGKYLGSDTNPYLALITSRSSTVTSYEIHPDTRILAEYAIAACNKLTSITIPDSVKFIGMGAFDNDYSLASVTFGNGAVSIGEIAFYGCTKLTSVHIGSGVVSIGEGAFRYCTGLTSVSIADSVTSIGKNAFEYCRNLTKVIYCGTQEQWAAVQKGYPNTVLYGETLQLHNYENGTCTICQHCNYIAGDINGDNVVDQKDAIYLLLYSWYGEEFYPMEYAPGDVNSDGTVEQKDAIYLLLHSWYGEEFYPLYPAPVPAPDPGEEEKPKPGNTGTPIA